MPRACCSAKTSLVKQDLADFKPMEAGGFLIGDNGSLGGFEALRLVRFVFRGVGERWGGDRTLEFTGEGDLSPLRGWFSWGDGTQRSRAGLSSGGPPGLEPWFGKTRSCQGVSGSNPVLLREFSIPMPMPMPIPRRAARVCRAGSSSAGGVSVRRHVGWEQRPFASSCDSCGHPPVIEAKGSHAKTRRREGVVGLSFGEDVADEIGPRGFQTGGSSEIPSW